MIIEAIFNAIFKVVTFIIDLFPTIPGSDLSNSVYSVFNFIAENLDLIDIFVNPVTFKVLAPLCIGVIYFEEIYSLIMWIVKKLPFSIE